MKRAHIEKALKRNSTCASAIEAQMQELERQKGKLFRIRSKLIYKAYDAGYITNGDKVTTEVPVA